MALFKTEGIVLKTMEIGEADRLIVLLSPSCGKIRAVARGARKVMSRFSAATDSFLYCHFVLYRGRTLDTVTQCEVRDSFKCIREDVTRFAFAGYVADLCDSITPDGGPAAALFPLLLTALRSIDRGADPETVSVWFALKSLSVAGYRPVLDRCAGCGDTGRLAGQVRFDPAAGGIVCPQCGERGTPVLAGTAELMRFLLGTDTHGLKAIRPDRRMLGQARAIIGEFVGYHCGRAPKSLKVIDSLS